MLFRSLNITFTYSQTFTPVKIKRFNLKYVNPISEITTYATPTIQTDPTQFSSSYPTNKLPLDALNNNMNFGSERFQGGSADSIGISSASYLNTWQQIVVVHDGSYLYMYRNGILAAGPTATVKSITNTQVTLNVASRGAGSYLDGIISATRIYNRALTPNEIQQNFNALRGRYGI